MDVVMQSYKVCLLWRYLNVNQWKVVHHTKLYRMSQMYLNLVNELLYNSLRFIPYFSDKYTCINVRISLSL